MSDKINIPYGLKLQEAMDLYVASTIKAFNGNISLTARALNISRSTLRVRISKIGINSENDLEEVYPKNCEFCGVKKDLNLHHVVPKSIGGDDSRENHAIICEKCHKKLHKRFLNPTIRKLTGR